MFRGGVSPACSSCLCASCGMNEASSIFFSYIYCHARHQMRDRIKEAKEQRHHVGSQIGLNRPPEASALPLALCPVVGESPALTSSGSRSPPDSIYSYCV